MNKEEYDKWIYCETLDGRWFYINIETGEKLPYGVQPICTK